MTDKLDNEPHWYDITIEDRSSTRKTRLLAYTAEDALVQLRLRSTQATAVIIQPARHQCMPLADMEEHCVYEIASGDSVRRYTLFIGGRFQTIIDGYRGYMVNNPEYVNISKHKESGGWLLPQFKVDAAEAEQFIKRLAEVEAATAARAKENA